MSSCAFYDEDNKRCTIYEARPIVCKTYGDPDYNVCPYQDFKPGELTELVRIDPEKAEQLHKTAASNPARFMHDFVMPYIEAFQNSNPEYMSFWKSLPHPNFIRK